jgi:hypothetical protein
MQMLNKPASIPPCNNDQFMRAIFAGLADPLRPFVLSFPGNPKERKAWGGEAYRPDTTTTDGAALNWYFTLGTYHPADGGYHRQEGQCATAYGVMLDDLGTKALPLERLNACPPSFVIETSPGNYQATYLFNEPQSDLASVKALNYSMVEAGLCDPGAKSPPTRWGRLPFAVNGKTDPAFQCRLVEWHPDRRYEINEIYEGLQLPHAKAAGSPRRKLQVARPQSGEDGIFIPRSGENEVLQALKKRGLYKLPLGGGKHDVTCPWVHEHTDQIDHGTAYFEPNDIYSIGGFKCQHGHGDKYRVSALLQFLSVSVQSAKHKPTIKVEPGELDRIVDSAESVLADTGRYYQRGGLIVSIATDPERGETTIKPVTLPALLRALSSAASWLRYDARAKDEITCDPPSRHVQVLFSSESYRHLPALCGIARQPFFRADGSMVSDAGFDAATGHFGVFDARQFPLKIRPGQAQASQALADLSGLLSEFTFASEHDKSAAVAAMLTAALRVSLPAAPMYHIKAPQIASGKSYLSSIIAAFAGDSNPSAIAFPTSEDECQKLLLASLLSAPSVLLFDNLTTDLLPFKSLCSALTEGFLTGRILGLSKTATVGTRAMFLSSGNNVEPVGDMARRCITIELDPQVEVPATRKFSGDPLARLRADRPHFVTQALTIVQAWIAAGSPATNCRPLASYGRWSEWVRQPLLWLGLPDPAEGLFEQLGKDPDRQILDRLLCVWNRAFGNSPTMIREAVRMAENGSTEHAKDLRDALLEIAEVRGEIDRRRLGRWIARHQGRIVSNLRFERADGVTSAERWICRSVKLVM